MRRRWRAPWWLSPLLVLAAWEAASVAGWLRRDYFPPPSALVGNYRALVGEEELLRHVGATLGRLGVAFVLAAVPGVLLGLGMGLVRPARLLLEPFVSGLYAIPKIALLPLIMLVMGIGEPALIVTASITAFFQITVSTMAGVLQVEPVLLEAARNYGATGHRLFFRVILPAVLPHIFTGLRLGLGLALILVSAVEITAAQTGLGFLIWHAWQVFRVEHMYCTFGVIGAIGLAITHGLEALGAVLMPWREAVWRPR
ncbi:MAG: ABC transporter permease [Deltaproteobacteria bacterium]|nr:ABC transporter permease [Deltaproteobacteria bacterium]